MHHTLLNHAYDSLLSYCYQMWDIMGPLVLYGDKQTRDIL